MHLFLPYYLLSFPLLLFHNFICTFLYLHIYKRKNSSPANFYVKVFASRIFSLFSEKNFTTHLFETRCTVFCFLFTARRLEHARARARASKGAQSLKFGRCDRGSDLCLFDTREVCDRGEDQITARKSATDSTPRLSRLVRRSI